MAYNFIDNTDNYLVDGLLFENFYEHSLGATHKVWNVSKLICNNVEGIFNTNGTEGMILNNQTIYPLSATEILTSEGANSLYQERQIYAASPALSGATGLITFSLPSNAQILGVTMRVNTLITGATSWAAAFSGGATDAICTGTAVAKNTKVYKMFGTLPVTTDITNITLTAAGGNFTAGVVSAVVRYRFVNVIADAA